MNTYRSTISPLSFSILAGFACRALSCLEVDGGGKRKRFRLLALGNGRVELTRLRFDFQIPKVAIDRCGSCDFLSRALEARGQKGARMWR